MQYVFWWAELTNKQTNKIWLQAILCECVCVDWVGLVFHFQGHQILVLWTIICILSHWGG